MAALHAQATSSAPAMPRCDRALLQEYETYLALRAPRTRDAYLRDLKLLVALAGNTALVEIPTPQLRRFLAVLHGRGLSGRRLARVFSLRGGALSDAAR